MRGRELEREREGGGETTQGRIIDTGINNDDSSSDGDGGGSDGNGGNGGGDG